MPSSDDRRDTAAETFRRDNRTISSEAESVPEAIGRFPIQRRLGRGAFGAVYLARDEQLDRLVAIKVPVPDRFQTPEDLERFNEEARLAARLTHPGIVSVYQVDRDHRGNCFVVLEYVEGLALRQILASERPSQHRAASIMAEVADALQHAHERGLVHRDLKPDNILLDQAGQPHVTDFGLAVDADTQRIRKGEVAGTPAYMAPEQVRGETHRLDGRTDVWSAGVVLYTMLTGRHPFSGHEKSEVFDEILNREPRPLRQWDQRIAKELQRICLKCLAKRMSDRYATAGDLGEDLRFWLDSSRVAASDTNRVASGPDPSAHTPETIVFAGGEGSEPSARVRPKGLRPFGMEDADFFLELLPGPRDRNGLPESVRFWKQRIEERQSAETFGVGLICGPSGSGKTSMVRAGLFSRLAPFVRPVYVEATAVHTESRLLSALDDRVADPLRGMTLAEAMAGIRGGRLLAPTNKILLVIDQFEQWLHGRRAAAGGQLAEGLRHCDGGRVQCLLLVRDDFAMAAARFMRELEVSIVEGWNFATVDRFDKEHAQKVLAEIGRGYRQLPDDLKSLTAAQQQFLDQAVDGLAREGRIAPVRVAAFSEMFKNRPWEPSTLKSVGGTEGIGVTFLEEMLGAHSRNPKHRLHQRAARAVLEALLPEQGTDIRGHMQSLTKLEIAAGYAPDSVDFAEVLNMLDNELRLITPTDPEGRAPDDTDAAGTAQRESGYYQLTHDYLVGALRQWLTRKQRETARGRARLRMAECASAWNHDRKKRYLPSWWEALVILIYTRRRERTQHQQAMMGAAARHYGLRSSLALLGLIAISLVALEAASRLKAAGFVRALATADTKDVGQIVADMSRYRRWTQPLLVEMAEDDQADSKQRLHASLALLPMDSSVSDELFSRMLKADPVTCLAIRNSLLKYCSDQPWASRLWAVAEDPNADPPQRFRAAIALVALDPIRGDQADPKWSAMASLLVQELIEDIRTSPSHYSTWLAAIQPARPIVTEPLMEACLDRDRPQRDRLLATSLFVELHKDSPDLLSTLLLRADPEQFSLVMPKLRVFRVPVVKRLAAVLAQPQGGTESEEVKDQIAKRKSNAAAGLACFGDVRKLPTLLAHTADPRLRTYIIDRLPRTGVEPSLLLRMLDEEPSVSVQRALILSLAGYSRNVLLQSAGNAWVDRLLDYYRNSPDAGVHSAAEFGLRSLDQHEKLAATDREIASHAPLDGRNWYVNTQRHTMVVLHGPITARLGSPPEETDRDSDEWLHTKRINRSFAIAAKEVTVEQFLRFRREKKWRNYYVQSVDCPVNVVTWYDAAQYCNWLSEQEGIAQSHWCFPHEQPIADGMRPKVDYLALTGYRLPTEAEWEYGCRAGSTTARPHGYDPAMLDRYAWHLPHSDARLWPAGSLKPNDFGLFDMLGSVKEWCQQQYVIQRPPPMSDDEEDLSVLAEDNPRVVRGGSVSDAARMLRSANRRPEQPKYGLSYSTGFRVARTISEIDRP